MNQVTPVVLTYYDSCLFVKPWIHGLWPNLTYNKKMRQNKWPYNFTSEPRYMYSVRTDKDGIEIGLVYGGMYQTVRDRLLELGYTYVENDMRPEIPDYDLDMCQPLRPLQDGALNVILSEKSGVIQCPPGFGKTFLMCQVCRIYDEDIKILIVTPRKSVVSDIYDRVTGALKGLRQRAILLNGSKRLPKRKNYNIIVCTSGSIHKVPSDWPDMLLYDECHGAATDKQLPVLERLAGCRNFGLSASPEGRLDGADMEITGLFGPVKCHVTYRQAQEQGLVCEIRVTMRHIQMDPIVFTKRDTDTDKQKKSYWLNHARNSLIAQDARSFTDEEQVIILVRTVEHALQLRMLIPEFFVVSGEVDDEKWEKFCQQGLVADTPEFRKALKTPDAELMRDLFKHRKIRKVIATGKWREGVDFPHLDGLIRADGSSGAIDAIQIVGRLSRVVEGKKYGRLIDYTDTFTETAKKKAKTREKHYVDQEWDVTYA